MHTADTLMVLYLAHPWHVSAVDALTASEYFPTPQFVHAMDPGFVLYLPATQATQLLFTPDQPALQRQNVILALPGFESAFTHSRHCVLLSAEYEPDAQSLHVSFVYELTVTEYFPAAQSEHPIDPGLDLYLPGTHPVQTLFVPVHPALQTHAVTAVLPAGEIRFAGHAAQSPVSDLYSPALQAHISDTGTVEIKPSSHNVHVKPSPRKPSLQVVHTKVITSGLLCPPAQIVQPTLMPIVENLPSAQSEHASDPAAGLYLPTAQTVQLPTVPVQPASQTHEVELAIPLFESAFTHNRHFVLSSAEYEPYTQSLHVSIVYELTRTEFLPATQSVQIVDPVLGLYLPATHPVQTPSVPVQPALQIHDIILTLPGSESVFTQSRHFVVLYAEYSFVYELTGTEYFPASHILHTIDPLMRL